MSPAVDHYNAIKRIFKYLAGSLDRGITYWRSSYVSSLPSLPFPTPLATPDDIRHIPNTSQFYGYVDSDWAADSIHRHSISGMVFMMNGGAIAWKTRVQPTMSTSSTEAEFLAASDAGKLALYICSILDNMGVPQTDATLIYEDNWGALLLAQAGRQTKHSRHIEIRHFALQDWIERDLLHLLDISTSLNASDIMTKQTQRLIFNWHCDLIFGHRPPARLLRPVPSVHTLCSSTFFPGSEQGRVPDRHSGLPRTLAASPNIS